MTDEEIAEYNRLCNEYNALVAQNNALLEQNMLLLKALLGEAQAGPVIPPQEAAEASGGPETAARWETCGPSSC